MADNVKDRGRSKIPKMNNEPVNESMDARFIEYINNHDESQAFI